MKIDGKQAASMAIIWGMSVISGLGAQATRTTLTGHVPAITRHLTAKGSLAATNRVSLAIGLPLHDAAGLETLISQIYDPQSTNYHHFLTPPEFTARFAPTAADYENVVQFAATNGLTVKTRHSNRLVLDVEGSAADIGRAFGVSFQTYRHPTEARDFYAPNQEPSVPAGLPVSDMWGMENYNRPHPMAHPLDQNSPVPLNNNGSGPSGYYRGTDFRTAYAPGTVLKGTGQIVAIAEFDGYYAKDITTYEAQAGYTTVPVQSVLLDSVTGTPGYSGITDANLEVSLDIETVIAMAPGLTKVIVVEGTSPYDVFNQIATNNVAKQVSCSWGFFYGPTHNWSGHGTLDSILMEMVAQGQSFFQASGDSDAYTGSQTLTSANSYIPTDSPYVVCVGGTFLNMNGTAASWASETVWNRGGNVGSGGGVSSNYTIPAWQAGVNMSANNGSSVYRNLPDVALTAESVYVVYSSGGTTGAGGTSCAAPLWAGFCALINQQEAAGGVTNSVGFLNPAVYALAATTNYTNCFHDITSGNNIGNYTAGLYYATNGYDLATGLGTPNGTNLINALAPLPGLLAQLTNVTARAGTNLTFSVTAVGAPPLALQWQLAGTNLPGATAAALTLNSVSNLNAGAYRLVITNAYGAYTSSVATLTVAFPPAITAQPVGLTVLSGSNAVFATTLSGNTPLACQWWKDGVKLTNGTGIAGATTNVLTLTGVTTNRSGNYSLAVTNLYGATTSSVANLTVVLPPTLLTTVSNQTLECGNNVVNQTVAATGTAPLSYQWSLDATPVTGATNTTFSLTNLSLPNHTISVAVTNLYGSVTSSAALTVQDTLAPVITLTGGTPIFVELGGTFTDPGAVAIDTCAGSVAVRINGGVSTGSVSTNTLVYAADDGNGNTNTVTRAVIVRDTTPPVVQWSFTNLVLAAGTNCSGVMPDVTGTNSIIASDTAGILVISQSPTNGAVLALGTNLVIITVADPSGNSAYSTNTLVVVDAAVPVLVVQPQGVTNTVGATAVFSVGATACSPVGYQWFFNNTPLATATNVSLTQSNLTLAQAGNYFAVATSTGGATTSAVVTLAVNLIAATVTPASSANPAGFNHSVVFSATVNPTNATGSIAFLTNGTAFDTEPLVAGLATSTNLTTLPRGTNSITVIYSGDAADLAATNMLAQIVTNHPPVGAPVAYSYGAGTVLSIALTNLAAQWSDGDGDPVSLAAISQSTNGVTVTYTDGTLTYANPNSVNDQFTLTLTDGWGGTNYEIVNVTVVLPAISNITANPDGSLTLQFAGAPGNTYVLEATSSLFPSNWQPVSTNTLDGTGTFNYSLTPDTSTTRSFYRLRLAQ